MERTISDSTQAVMASGTQIRSPVMKYFFKGCQVLAAQLPVPPWHGGTLLAAGAGVSGFDSAGLLPPSLANDASRAYERYRRLQQSMRLLGREKARVPRNEVAEEIGCVLKLWEFVFEHALLR